MEMWSFLISPELPEGRVEMGNYSLPFKSKIGVRVCIVAEQRHKNLHFELDDGGAHL